MIGEDRAERQAAFVGLLACPLVTPWSQPTVYGLVRRHARVLEQWATRLGYRLIRINRCYRLRRPPLGGVVALPAGVVPQRATLILGLYAAVCLEAHRDDSITLQELSDRVAQFASQADRRRYDPNLLAQRRTFVTAVELLVAHGVLEKRTGGGLQDDWERHGTGIGAGFLVHRDALMLLVDTADVDAALAARAAVEDDARSARALRSLLETQALYPDELDDDERAYLLGQRARLVRLAEEMTGGVVEVRSDAWVLVLPPSRELPEAVRIGFPDATAVDWVSLAMVDALARQASGFHRVPGATVDAAAAAIHADKAKHLTQALRESPDRIREAAENRLGEIGVLRVEGADWVFTPAAGRYRNADLAEPSEPEELPW